MPRLTITIPEEQAERIAELADSDEYESKSDAVRGLIEEAERVGELETTIERLQNEKRALIGQYQEHNELVRYVEDQQEYRDQPFATRLKWRLFGREDD